MEKIEKLFCYATTPIVMVTLFGAGLIVGSLFIVIGAVGYIRLQIENRRMRLS
jgi:uncharacterized membrane protein YciS (DUF1049 family)